MTSAVRRNPAAPDTRIHVFSWDDWTGKWVHEGDGTLAEFLDAKGSTPAERAEMAKFLQLRRLVVGGNGAGKWKVTL